jgi:hypothetical protein
MNNYLKMLSAAGLACLSGASFADTAPVLSPVAKLLADSGITATGHVSASYQTGFNDGTALGGRAFDSKTDSFTLNQAALTISSLPAEGFGALVNVIAGDDASVLNGSYGDGSGKFNLTQAYVQYATGGLTVMGGRYVTLAGYEVIDDANTPHISRSFLFQNAEPLVHTGVRASYKVNDMVTGYLGAANSAFSGLATDDNKLKTIEAGVALTPSASTSIGIYDYYGIDGSTTHQKTNYLDVVVSFKASDALTLALNADYLRYFGPGSAPGSEVKGVAGYAAFQVTDMVAIRGRVEYVKLDPNGAKSDSVQTYTGTVVVSPSKNLDLLGEVRYDNDKKSYSIFPDGAGTKDSQGDVAIKAIYKF